jgi:hypothetical protein
MYMALNHVNRLVTCVALVCLVVLGLGAPAALAQTTSTGGTLNVTVADPSGAAVPGASLEIRDLSTNDVRRADTQVNGVHSFPNLPFGTYELKVTANGFTAQVFQAVQIQTGRETDVHVNLKIGTPTETVTVESSETPLVQTESSQITSTIDTKQVFNLPVNGRSAFGLVYLTPGWATTGNGNGNSTGTFNNLPGGAIVSADFDGTAGMSNRFRSSGYNAYGTTVVTPRIENIAEMSISTAQLDLSGNGTSAMRISIVTKRGTNEFHGRLYEDFRNTVLNANSWSNNANSLPRSITKFNEFGGSIGGPIIKNKLFFFGTWSEQKNPNTTIVGTTVMSPLAQQGIFQYKDNAGNIQQVDLFKIAAANGLPSTVLPAIATQLKAINGVYGQGTVVPSTSDPNTSTFNFVNPSNSTIYYPTIRGDYNMTEKLRFNVSYTQQKTIQPNTYAPNFPGLDTVDRSSYQGNNKIAGFGVDYTIKPTLINQFHAGYLYQYSIFDPENLGLDLPNIHAETWATLGTGTAFSSVYGGSYPRTAISSLYQQLSYNDSLSWQRGAHSIVFGTSWYRELDKYWNGPGGWPRYSINSLNSNDPAYNAITNGMPGVSTTLQGQARALYANLVGRIAAVNISVGRPLDPKTKEYKPFGQYNLNEVQSTQGLWAQDRWRVRRDLTLNYGLRWDIVGDDYDKDGAYTSARSLADLYGPTPVGKLFQPGVLGGIDLPQFVARQHVYNTSWKNPQPAVAIAWNPSKDSGILGKILGNGKTVIRTGYSLRNYQEGAQNFWALASGGLFFYQQGSVNPDPSLTTAGYFKPGSLTLGDPIPPYLLNPNTWSPVITADQQFGGTYNTINPNIRQPYVQQWNFGIQREIRGGNAIEVNYVGNLTLHSWLSVNQNEVNIFENGFLQEFKNAQNNLAINRANGKGATPFNNGLPGQVPLPIMTAAFGAASTGSGWTAFTTQFDTGAAGAMARTMLSTTSYLCNVVGSVNFSACNASVGVNTPGKYPLNFWNANPWARTAGLNYLDASGSSNYQALQATFRQRYTHGMQFTFNYTLGHSLVLGSVNNIQSQGFTPSTLRNLQLNYGPSPYDIRHVFRAAGTYDLPFGKGKQFLHEGRVLDAIVGHWTLGNITSIQSGNPGTITGGYSTVTGADSGVNFTGTTANDFQNGVQVINTGLNYKLTIDPKFIAANGMANPAYLTSASTPGVFGYSPVIRAPMWWSTDLSVTKSVPITERFKLTLQGSAVNAFNHATIGLGTLNVTSTSFGRATPGANGPRRVEVRANLEF